MAPRIATSGYRRRLTTVTLVGCACVLWAVGAASAAGGGDPPCYYDVTVLDLIPDCGFGGDPGSITPLAIADNGWITGRHPQCDFDGGSWVALNTGGTAVQELIPPFEGVWRASGFDITTNGLIVGSMWLDSGERGFLYDHEAGNWIELPGLVDSTFSQAVSVNTSGVAVGKTGNQITGPSPLAVMWVDGAPVDLSAELGAQSSEALGINESGSIVGWMGDSQATASAFLLETDGTLHTLAPPGNFQSAQGVAVNRWGDVAGRGRWQASPSDPVVLHAFLWNPFTDEFLDLGTLPGSTFSRSYDINDRREIVGLCNNSGLSDQVGFLWRDGEMIAVESLDAPSNDYEFQLAYGITHLGSIAGVVLQEGEIITFASVFEPPVPADLNDDCVVDVWDLVLLISDWGAEASVADLTGDGIVDVSDLLHLLGHWG